MRVSRTWRLSVLHATADRGRQSTSARSWPVSAPTTPQGIYGDTTSAEDVERGLADGITQTVTGVQDNQVRSHRPAAARCASPARRPGWLGRRCL